jgi:hypothetical protein
MKVAGIIILIVVALFAYYGHWAIVLPGTVTGLGLLAAKSRRR